MKITIAVPMLLATLVMTLPAMAQRAPLLLEPVASGFSLPLFATAPPGDTGRIFVLEKESGLVLIVKDGVRLAEPFLNIKDLISTQSERGLLGISFHPDYAENGAFFLSYTRTNGASVLSRWQVSDDPDVADAASESVLMVIPQPAQNHNGGMIAFGPDGYLYFGVGDGGGSGDPFENGQDRSNPLGAMLRIDVDTPGPDTPYSIPADNPFVDTAGADPRIWAYGLRNPWRFSFDRETGDLWIADVGQNTVEWIHFQPAGSEGGQNYGWPVFEGDLCFDENPLCDSPELFVPPIFVYDRDFGRSITGGYAYRGGRIPWLEGVYLYGDYLSSRIAGFRWDGATVSDFTEFTDELRVGLSPTLGLISSFGEDGRGEVLVVEYNRGRVSRIVPDTIPEDVTASGEVNAVDVQFVINAALGLDTGNLVTDVNGDGEANAIDVQLVINAALGVGTDND